MKWNNQRGYENLFDELFDRKLNYQNKSNCGCNPLANVIENDENFELHLSVPGYGKKDISINLENNVLTIASEKEENQGNENTNFTMKEFSHTGFTRSFTLPKSVNTDMIKANYESGVLNLTLPKKEEEKMKLNKEIKIA